jgi:hypothetical protein
VRYFTSDYLAISISFAVGCIGTWVQSTRQEDRQAAPKTEFWSMDPRFRSSPSDCISLTLPCHPHQEDGTDPYQEDGTDPYQEDGTNPYQKDGTDPYQEDGTDPYQEDGTDPYQKDGTNLSEGWDRPLSGGRDKPLSG